MFRKALCVLALLIVCEGIVVQAQSFGKLTMRESDGQPRAENVVEIVVSPGTLSCTGGSKGRVCTLTTGGGGGGGTGDVVGPASATDNAVVRFDLTTGKLVQNSVVIVGDTGNITGAGTLNTHTIPGGTDTFALLNATQTLASKTLSSPLVSGTLIQTSNAAQAFCSGPNGCTNPVLSTVNNVASAATGVSITGNAAGAGADIQVTSSAAIDNLNIRTKGAGQISFFNNAIETFRLWTQSTSLFGTHIRYQNGVSGTSKAFWDLSNVNFRLASDGYYGFSSSTDATGAADWRIVRAAAGVGRLGGSSTTDAGNLLVGTSSGAIGTSGAGVIAAALSTAPANSTDTSQAYSTDFNAVAGDARWHFLSETGNPIGLGNNSIGMQNPIAANGASQAGRAFTVFGSAATASLDTAGAAAGGNVNINTGAAARLTSGNANGGDFNVVLGAGIGTGTSGVAAFSESGASRGTRFRGQGAYSGRVAVEWYESGGSIRNSIVGAMGSGNDLIFFGSSGSTEYGRYDSLGNWMVGTSSSPASLAKGLVIGNGTAATAGAADKIGLWSADATAGDANLYSINEAGQINRLTGLAVRNSAQFDVTSSTALATITGLTENVEAGRTYAFRAYVQTSAGAGGVKFAVGGTATATAISYEGELTSASDDNVVLIDRAAALGTVVCDSSTTTSGTCKIEGVIQVNAAGTLVIQFAQSVSNGTASSVLANQYLQLIPIS